MANRAYGETSKSRLSWDAKLQGVRAKSLRQITEYRKTALRLNYELSIK